MSLDWCERQKPEGGAEILLNYFHRDDREIERHFIMLAAVHCVILKAFDRCFDGGIGKDPEMVAALNEFQKIGQRVNAEYQEKYGVAPETGDLGSP